jgi:hypothetical protein
MYLGELLHIWRRRWILTTALIILALIGAASALQKLPRTYQSQSSVVLLASRSAAKATGGNPYLSFSASLTLTADILGREMTGPAALRYLAARGVDDTYTVALAPDTTTTTGSVLLVTVTGHSKDAVESALRAVTSDVGLQLARMQDSVAPRNQIRAATISFSPQATLSTSQTARSLVPVVALELLVGLWIPVLLDGLVTRRRMRRRAVLASEIPRPAEQMTYETARR